MAKHSPTIKAYRDKELKFHTFLIVIDDDVWEMDNRANQPNGVCVYGGKLDDLDLHSHYEPMENIPIKAVQQIINQIYWDKDKDKDKMD